MNKQLSTFFSAAFLIVAMMFCGIGLYRTATDYWNPPTIVSLQSSDITVQNNQRSTVFPICEGTAGSFITGPLTANTGELCVFKLNATTAQADWVIVPSATAYIDSSGSSLAFASNVPAKYTVIAAIVEDDGLPKILTHVCEYGTSPEPGPAPNPNPAPPATLKDWVTQNVPTDGRVSATALAVCYEAVADSIHKGTIKTVAASFALLRSATQTKVNIDVWKDFLDELSTQITEHLKGSTDIKTLGTLFSEIAAGLKAVSEIAVEPEVSTGETVVLPE